MPTTRYASGETISGVAFPMRTPLSASKKKHARSIMNNKTHFGFHG
jgi:hypothetical protein